jgi:hypothetical protein
MTSAAEGSGRWSGRVEHDIAITPGQPPADAITGHASRNTFAPTGGRSESRNRRVSRRQLDLLSKTLSDRDRAILMSLDSYGLLRTTHLQQLHFTTHSTPDAAARICRRVLKRLSEHRLIEPIERRIGGIRAGSSGTVWRVGPSGDRLLRAGDHDAARSRRREPSLRFLEHRMLVADVACAVTTAAGQGSFELLRIEPEPASWRDYSGLHGGRDTLKPDLFVVTAAGDYEDHWFIEVDRGTESLPTLLKQCHQYETYRHSGREQGASGVFPWVLWLLPDEHRRGRLREAIHRDDDLDTELFRAHIYDELLRVITGDAV